MRDYLKFVVAVFGITVAIFGSINVNAKSSSTASTGCDNSIKTCGHTPEGNVITGNYSTAEVLE